MAWNPANTIDPVTLSKQSVAPWSSRFAGARFAPWRPLLGASAIWLVVRMLVLFWAIAVHAATRQGSRVFSQPDWLFRLFFHWDSVYFAGIAKDGYFGAGSLPTWQAFFPGYPAAARGVAALLGGAHPTSTQIIVALGVVAASASLIATALFWRLVEDSQGPRAAAAATVLFVGGPYSLFLVASYSEGLFLVFAIGAWLCASRGNWLPAGILAAGASLTRINGVFLVVALVVLYVLVRRRRREPYLARAIGLGCIGLSTVGAYFAFLFFRTGDPLAWTHAENAGWHRTIEWPWATLYRTLDDMLHGRTDASRLQSGFEVIFAALFVLSCIVLVRRRWWAEATLVGLTTLSLMTSSSYLSLARTSLVLFPLPILVVTTLSSRRWRWVYWTVFAAGIAVLLINTRQFTLGLWSD